MIEKLSAKDFVRIEVSLGSTTIAGSDSRLNVLDCSKFREVWKLLDSSRGVFTTFGYCLVKKKPSDVLEDLERSPTQSLT